MFDLALRLYNTEDIRQVLQAAQAHFSFQKPNQILPIRTYSKKIKTPETTVDENSIIIRHVQYLGNNPAITEYLHSRGISLATAIPFCREVYFRIKDKSYFALGFQNRSGGYELRNRHWKGSSSPKDITLINNGATMISVLEGLMDFLSLLIFLIRPINSDFIILNSNSHILKSIPLLKGYRDVNLFLDNDLSGEKAKNKIWKAGIKASDLSFLYGPFKDINDWLLQKPIKAEKKIYKSFKL